MLLARLAVDHRCHGQGIGKALLKDAMLRTVQAADIAGIRAFAVHAKDDDARRFYLKFDFIPIPCGPDASLRALEGRAADYFRAVTGRR